MQLLLLRNLRLHLRLGNIAILRRVALLILLLHQFLTHFLLDVFFLPALAFAKQSACQSAGPSTNCRSRACMSCLMTNDGAKSRSERAAAQQPGFTFA